MVNDYGLFDFIHRTINRGSGSMVLDCGTSGDICGSGNPDCDYGIRSGDWETGDCLMVTPELEDSIIMDEILSDLSSVCADGNHVSGYLRFSLQGTS